MGDGWDTYENTFKRTYPHVHLKGYVRYAKVRPGKGSHLKKNILDEKLFEAQTILCKT